MTPAQWSRFIAAVQKLKENGGYDDLVMLHNRSMAIGHRHERIWPWHRGLIYMFYARLRAIDSGLTVFPYWPADHPMAQQIFNPNFHAFVGGNGDPNNEYRVMDGPMANWPVIDPRTLRYREAPGVKRNLDMAWLPSQGHVNGLLGIGAYRNFWWRMEENPHDFIHSFVIGGDMSAGTSPSDIVFWLLHGWLDVVYNFWQVRHGRTNYSGNPSERMRNIAGTPIASSLFNPRDKHYGYQWYTMGSQSLSAASRGIESFSVGTNPPHQSDLVVQYMKDGSIMVGDAHFGPEWFHPNDDGTVTFGPLMYGRYRWEDIGYAIAFAIDTGIIPPDGGSMHHH